MSNEKLWHDGEGLTAEQVAMVEKAARVAYEGSIMGEGWWCRDEVTEPVRESYRKGQLKALRSIGVIPPQREKTAGEKIVDSHFSKTDIGPTISPVVRSNLISAINSALADQAKDDGVRDLLGKWNAGQMSTEHMVAALWELFPPSSPAT